MAESWTIAEVADHLGMDAGTLRYYEKRGIVPGPARNSAGHRVYGPGDVHLLEVLMHLKSTGMPLGRIAEFTRLVALDPDGVTERLSLLTDHRVHVREQIAAWQRSLDVIDGKIADYRRR